MKKAITFIDQYTKVVESGLRLIWSKNMKRVIVVMFFTCNALAANAEKSAEVCFDQLDSNPVLSRLLPHVGSVSKTNAATFQMMVSKLKPSKAEKEAIAVWGLEQQKCADMYRESLPQGLPPAAFEIEAKSQSDMQQLLVTLYRGQLSYGEFIEFRKKLGEVKITKLRELLSQEQTRQQQQENEKMQRDSANEDRARQQAQYEASVRAQKEAADQAQFNSGIDLLLKSRPRPPAPPTLIFIR